MRRRKCQIFCQHKVLHKCKWVILAMSYLARINCFLLWFLRSALKEDCSETRDWKDHLCLLARDHYLHNADAGRQHHQHQRQHHRQHNQHNLFARDHIMLIPLFTIFNIMIINMVYRLFLFWSLNHFTCFFVSNWPDISCGRTEDHLV